LNTLENNYSNSPGIESIGLKWSSRLRVDDFLDSAMIDDNVMSEAIVRGIMLRPKMIMARESEGEGSFVCRGSLYIDCSKRTVIMMLRVRMR